MPIADRDYAKEPLSGERVGAENPRNLVDDLHGVELVMTGDGYKIEKRRDVGVVITWRHVMFWVVLLLVVRSCGAG